MEIAEYPGRDEMLQILKNNKVKVNDWDDESILQGKYKAWLEKKKEREFKEQVDAVDRNARRNERRKHDVESASSSQSTTPRRKAKRRITKKMRKAMRMVEIKRFEADRVKQNG